MLQATTEVASAAVALVVADALVRAAPFGRIARRIQGPLRRGAPDGAREVAVRRVRWSIAAAHRRLPWDVSCLATALAANRLLARRGVASELWLGVRPGEPTSVDAHAWLVADGCVVTGGVGGGAYRPLHALVTAPAPRP
jgi:hypothetical protein